jgi:leucyl aminopeptidase
VLTALAIKSGDFEAKPGKLLSAYRTPGVAATRVVLAGVGDASPKNVRSAVSAALGALKSSNTQRLILCFSTLDGVQPEAVRAAVTACSDATYTYTTTKSKASPAKLRHVVIAVHDAASAKAARAGLDKGAALVKGVEFAKEWANRPANYATPALLAGAAKELGKLRNIKVDVLGPKEVAKLGMGSFMAVAQGSAEPLRFIVLRYEGAAKAAAPVVLVGKGITFDTGGISIKPAAEMDEMKFDMCGAASVLGTFRALAELQPALNVVGLIPACENMPGSRAVKPGDVVTSMSGQTIEILNTDAEGRLVLCDALTYAERFKPRAVVDIATLTGACVIALGGVRSGLFPATMRWPLRCRGRRVVHGPVLENAAGRRLCGRLKTNFADVANVAGRAGGAITAAKFLQRFAASFPWAHLDIAGTAWKGGAAKGATGRPVPLLLDYLLGQVTAAKAKPSSQTSRSNPRNRQPKPGPPPRTRA